MKFQPDKTDQSLISAYDAKGINIGHERIESSLVLGSQGERFFWDVSRFEDLSSDHFTRLGLTAPELIIFGSGPRLRFPNPQWLAGLMAQRIGVETMDTPAACRTYNILAGEGRHVVAAFLMGTA